MFTQIKFIQNLETELNKYGITFCDNINNSFEYYQFANNYYKNICGTPSNDLILETNSNLQIICDNSLFNYDKVCEFTLLLNLKEFKLYTNFAMNDCQLYLNLNTCYVVGEEIKNSYRKKLNEFFRDNNLEFNL